MTRGSSGGFAILATHSPAHNPYQTNHTNHHSERTESV